MARAYDFWDPIERENYNQDGTMTAQYRQWLLDTGVPLDDTWAMEARKMAEVEEFEEREQRYLQLYGETWSDMTVRRGGQV